jgi:hypothetical protein
MTIHNAQPFPSWTWVVNEVGQGYWDAPIPMPRENGVVYKWNEEAQSWDAVTP